MPCLAGQDVYRKAGDVMLVAKNGALVDAHYGEPIKITRGDALKGWGSLDGDSYHLNYESGHYVSVPVDLLKGVADHAGIALQVA